ncbi:MULTISPECIES: hypothetical protein [Cyanophyceae]|nr:MULTISPECIES: hypothetical protein [Cyanophyceae]
MDFSILRLANAVLWLEKDLYRWEEEAKSQGTGILTRLPSVNML